MRIDNARRTIDVIVGETVVLQEELFKRDKVRSFR